MGGLCRDAGERRGRGPGSSRQELQVFEVGGHSQFRDCISKLFTRLVLLLNGLIPLVAYLWTRISIGYRHALPPPLGAGNDGRNGRSSSTEGAEEEAEGRVGVTRSHKWWRQGRGQAPSPSAPPPMAIPPRSSVRGFVLELQFYEPPNFAPDGARTPDVPSVVLRSLMASHAPLLTEHRTSRLRAFA
jgi:hypothetical protein